MTDDRAALERGYDNRGAVPDHPRWLARFAELSADARVKTRVLLDLRYGPNPLETLDLFLPKGRARGLLVFFHGGYWRALDKSDHSFVAPVFVARDIAVAVVNYDLCPNVSLATIVDESRAALAWLVREGLCHGVDTARVVLAGHSAGGHLVAMLYATPWAALHGAGASIVGGVSLSGVHDLEPLLATSVNADLRLDPEEARRWSPVHGLPITPAPLVIAVGAEETSEFRRQSNLLFAAWPRARPRGMSAPLVILQRHHFNVVLDWTDAASSLCTATLSLLGD